VHNTAPERSVWAPWNVPTCFARVPWCPRTEYLCQHRRGM